MGALSLYSNRMVLSLNPEVSTVFIFVLAVIIILLRVCQGRYDIHVVVPTLNSNYIIGNWYKIFSPVQSPINNYPCLLALCLDVPHPLRCSTTNPSNQHHHGAPSSPPRPHSPYFQPVNRFCFSDQILSKKSLISSTF